MKKVITFVITFFMLFNLSAVIPAHYLNLKFTKPGINTITVATDMGAKHISFGNPANVKVGTELKDGQVTKITHTVTVNYTLQTPGILYVFFSSKNDLGYDKGKGNYSNPYMLAVQGGEGGLNYDVSVVSSVTGTNKPATDDKRMINLPYDTVEFLDVSKKTIPPEPPAEPGQEKPKLHSGVAVRHYFDAQDIGTGLVGTDTMTLHMDVQRHSYKNGILPSGLYYGYIVVQYTVK